MSERKTVLFIGPFPPPTTGLSFAFEQVYKFYPEKKRLINLNYTEANLFRKIFILTACICRILWIAATDKNIELAYFTCTMTRSGNIRDIIIISILWVFKIKMINHLHGAGFNQLIQSLPKYQQKLSVWAFSKVDASIVLMEAMRNEFHLFKDTMTIYVVENFYDPVIDEHSYKPEKNNKTINILYFSNLMYSKGVLLLLDAFEQLYKKYPELRLNIAGHILDDKEMSKSKMTSTLNHYLNKYSTIHYHHLVMGEKKAEFLFRGDIFVLPTFYFREAFPISIIEAMRCGNAIITTEHNYLSHIVNEKQGRLIQPKSSQEIYSAIEFYIQNPQILKQQQYYNMEFAKSHYTVKYFTEQIYDIFEIVLDDQPVAV